MGIMGNIFRYLPNSIYGYDIAVKDALSAILRYGTFQSLVVFYDPRQYQEHIIRKIIKELQNRGQINAEIEFISTYELLKGSSQPQFDVMHKSITERTFRILLFLIYTHFIVLVLQTIETISFFRNYCLHFIIMIH